MSVTMGYIFGTDAPDFRDGREFKEFTARVLETVTKRPMSFGELLRTLRGKGITDAYRINLALEQLEGARKITIDRTHPQITVLWRGTKGDV